jgi:hypothetical protein
VVDVAHAICLLLEALVELLPEPESLDQLNHGCSWWKEYGIRQIARVHLYIQMVCKGLISQLQQMWCDLLANIGKVCAGDSQSNSSACFHFSKHRKYRITAFIGL